MLDSSEKLLGAQMIEDRQSRESSTSVYCSKKETHQENTKLDPRKSNRRHNSKSMNRQELHLIVLATTLIISSCALHLVQAGGKGGKGEGNIIISTGGGHSTKIKIMKVPVPYPVIKHVPYPVPVPIIQKKYIPVEKYVHVYKHHDNNHGSGQEIQAGYESQQHEQYNITPGSGQESTSSTASNYEATTQGQHQQQASAQISGYPQIYGTSSNEAHLMSSNNPYAAQMAPANGQDLMNLYPGPSGYNMGYSNGSPSFGASSAHPGAYAGAYGPGSMTGYAGYPGQESYGVYPSASNNLYGDSGYQQYSADINQFQPSASAMMYSSDSDSLYQQPSNGYSPPVANRVRLVGSHASGTSLTSPSTTSSTSPSSSGSGSQGSSSLAPHHIASSVGISAYSSRLPNFHSSQSSSTASTLTSSSSAFSPSSSSRGRGQPVSSESSKSDWLSSSSSKLAKNSSGSPISGSGGRASGYKTSTSSSKLISSLPLQATASTFNELVAVSSTPTTYHQSIGSVLAPNQPQIQKNEKPVDGQQKITSSIASPSNLSTILSTEKNNYVQAQSQTQQPAVLSGSILSSSQVGDQIMQRLRKFTNHLSNSTQTAQQVGPSAVKLLG